MPGNADRRHAAGHAHRGRTNVRRPARAAPHDRNTQPSACRSRSRDRSRNRV